MKLEVTKAFRQQVEREKKKQEKALRLGLRRRRQCQPESREIRYDNVRSAMAEEGVLQMVLKEPAMFEQCRDLTQEKFSSPLLGRSFELLRQRYEAGLSVYLGALGNDLGPAELSHLTAVAQKRDCLVSDQAMSDYLAIIETEYARGHVSSEEDLLEIYRRLQEKKGYGGNDV